MQRMTKDEIPTSFGAFKPVGHVVLALPDEARSKAAIDALHGAGFAGEDVLHFSATEKDNQMERLLKHTSEMAGFGYELTLMHRYQALSEEGCSWLIVFAPEDEQTARVAEVARAQGAVMAVKYNLLVMEELV